MAGISLSEAIAHEGLTEDILKQEISQKDELGLAKFCNPWERVVLELGLEKRDVSAIREDQRTFEMRQIEAMQRWKQRYSFKATYLVFIKALFSCEFYDKTQEALKFIASTSKYSLFYDSTRKSTGSGT